MSGYALTMMLLFVILFVVVLGSIAFAATKEE